MSQGNGGFTLVDFTIPTRDAPISHFPTEAPLCNECRSNDLCFFDPSCSGCQDILLDSNTSIPELFAVMRQWVPQTQRNVAHLTREILRRGANINDRDGLTDLTLLHYACKAGAVGIGNETAAANLVNSLIVKGANMELRCRWTTMNALHYAAYFDVAGIIEALLKSKRVLLMATCSEFEGGTALHIAASNLCLRAATTLVQLGADGSFKDKMGRIPLDCVPEVPPRDLEAEAAELTDLLKTAAENPPPPPRPASRNKQRRLSSGSQRVMSPACRSHSPLTRSSPVPLRLTDDAVPSHTHTVTVLRSSPVPTSGSSRNPSPMAETVTLATLGLKVGDRVTVDATSARPKCGTLRFGGPAEFAPGQWAGLELDEEIGKNDGSYGGIRYFNCKPKYGLFVPLHRVSKARRQATRDRKRKSIARQDSLLVTTQAIEAHSQLQMNSDLQIGERVVVGSGSSCRNGVLRFTGTVKFAPGFWLGVELDQAQGKNDGSVSGQRYFKCKPSHGVFVPPSKVTRATPSQTSSTADSTDHPLTSSQSSDGSCYSAMASSTGTPPARRRALGRLTPRSRPKPSSRTSSLASSSPTPISLALSPALTVEEGMDVFVNGEKAVVKFVGKTDFADGTWLGVALRKPAGKNDGSVKGKRYFSCKPLYGLFVRPEKATHRGINCSKMMKTTGSQKDD